MNEIVEKPPLVETVIDLMEGLIHWRDQIEEALRHAGFSYTFDDITSMILRQELTFYKHDDCFALCQIVHFPQYRNFHFMIVGGNLRSIIGLKSHYESIAKALDCKNLSFSGRPGWARALKNHGWEHRFTTMWSPIEYGE